MMRMELGGEEEVMLGGPLLPPPIMRHVLFPGGSTASSFHVVTRRHVRVC